MQYNRSMRLALALLLISCAAMPVPHSNAYEELVSCPVDMSQEQLDSGAVRCRADCASWGRGFVEFRFDCKCVCAPKPGMRLWSPQS